jgi:hypothetical protein
MDHRGRQRLKFLHWIRAAVCAHGCCTYVPAGYSVRCLSYGGVRRQDSDFFTQRFRCSLLAKKKTRGLVLVHASALPAGNGDCAAGLLPPSLPPRCTVQIAGRAHPSTRVPLRFIVWVLGSGWSTRCLCANGPTPCTCNTNYLHIMVLFNSLLHMK